MSAYEVVTTWGLLRKPKRIGDSDEARAKKSAGGRRSAEVRRAKGDLAAHMRRIAASGGRARQQQITPLERHRLSRIGGRAGWDRLTPEEARARRKNFFDANKRFTHEQRVSHGKLGAEKRWGKKT